MKKLYLLLLMGLRICYFPLVGIGISYFLQGDLIKAQDANTSAHPHLPRHVGVSDLVVLENLQQPDTPPSSQSNLSDHEAEAICDFAVRSYFTQRQISINVIKSHIQTHLRQVSESPHHQERKNLDRLRRLVMEPDEHKLPVKALQQLALNAVTDALEKQERSNQEALKKLKGRVTKKKSALTTTLVTAVSTLIGVIVTYYTQTC